MLKYLKPLIELSEKQLKLKHIKKYSLLNQHVTCSGHSNIRFSHTDIEFPDWDEYRRKSLRSPNSKTKNSENCRKTFTYMVSGTALGVGLYGVKAEVVRYVLYMAAAADVLALAKIEINLNDIPEGKNVTLKWRGKPLFIKHRTQEDIIRERNVPLRELRDPETDEQRCPNPEWLIVLGVCTHLGCVPIADAGDYNGYYCPCHGSHFDGSGRARKGPAPTNLVVPEHRFLEDNQTLIVG